MRIRIACVVEGHGDCEAAPLLLRRLAKEVDPSLSVEVPHPIRIPRDKLMKPGELERAVELAARTVRGKGGLVVLVDSDDGCPKFKAPELLQRARGARGDLRTSVILAKREYESWFLAAAESLRGKRNLALDLEPPPNPEDIRGAKEWLSDRMVSAHSYSETLDQPALTAVFDLNEARKARSFDK